MPETVDAKAREFVALGADLDTELVRPGYEHIAPNEDYATVIALRDRQIGSGARVESATNTMQQVRLYRQVEYQVNFHRDGARAKAERLLLWAASDFALIVADRFGFGIVRCDDLVDIPDFRSFDAKWESGVQVSLVLDYFLTDDFDSGQIDAVDITVIESGGTEHEFEVDDAT